MKVLNRTGLLVLGVLVAVLVPAAHHAGATGP